MAVGHEPLTRMQTPAAPFEVRGRKVAGIVALAFIALLIGGALAGLLLEAAGGGQAGSGLAIDAYIMRVARFTLVQAALSTLVSVVPAILLARALHRQPVFAGRALVLQLFAVPLAIPAIVAALGVLALYGRAGYFADALSGLWQGGWPGIYGLAGILVGHTFFNLPLATRLFLEALQSVPADRERLAAQLGMGARASFRLLEWPAMRAALPGIAGLVFMLCATSFTIVLTLGGGPAATTLEVAIYQSLRFDFDIGRAVTLTALQIGLTALIVAALYSLGANMTGDSGPLLARRGRIWRRPLETAANWTVIAIGIVFVAGPMAAIALSGLRADLFRLAVEGAVLRATATSLVLGALAAIGCVALSLALVAARRALELARIASRPGLLERSADIGASMVLVAPPIVIGAGWFILLRRFADMFAFAPVMVVTVNAVMAMPFAMRALRPAYDAASARHERLCAALGISGLDRLRIVDWPSIRRPAATAFAFAMALSLGDLGVIALFGSDEVRTLPYLLLQRMGSYRTADAAGLALFLGLCCLALMIIAERLGRERR